MATAHIYARVQARGSNAQIDQVALIAQALQEAVESIGGAWTGSVAVERDPEPDPVVEDEAPAAASGEEFDVDSQ